MALSKSGLKTRIITELETQGFVTTGTYPWTQKFAEALANAVVDEIHANAQATGLDSNSDTHDLAIS
jgi:hypothetical protein